MIHRVASALLVVALLLAGGSDLFARVPRRNPLLRVTGGGGRSVDTAGCVHLQGQIPSTNTLVGDRHHPLSAALETVAVASASVRVGSTPALVGFVIAGIVPDLPGQAVPVAANTRPNRQPRVVLAARAPPV